MTLKQMQSLLPLVEAYNESVVGNAFRNPEIIEHERVLDGLTPFSVPNNRGTRYVLRKYWVLDDSGRLQREFEA